MFYLAMQPALSQGGRKEAGLDSMLDPQARSQLCYLPSFWNSSVYFLAEKEIL